MQPRGCGPSLCAYVPTPIAFTLSRDPKPMDDHESSVIPRMYNHSSRPRSRHAYRLSAASCPSHCLFRCQAEVHYNLEQGMYVTIPMHSMLSAGPLATRNPSSLRGIRAGAWKNRRQDRLGDDLRSEMAGSEAHRLARAAEGGAFRFGISLRECSVPICSRLSAVVEHWHAVLCMCTMHARLQTANSNSNISARVIHATRHNPYLPKNYRIGRRQGFFFCT